MTYLEVKPLSFIKLYLGHAWDIISLLQKPNFRKLKNIYPDFICGWTRAEQRWNEEIVSALLDCFRSTVKKDSFKKRKRVLRLVS